MLVAKQHYNKEFFHLISTIKKASTKGQEVLFFKKVGNHSIILGLLVAEGLITSFQEHNNFVIIRLKSSKGSKSINILQAANRVGRKNYTISFKDLLSLQRKEGFSSYFVLNTDKGLLTSFSAIEKCVGGKLLLKIS